MTRLQKILQSLMATGEKHSFRLKDGTACLGWITAVDEEHLSFHWMPSHARRTANSLEEEVISLSAIDLYTMEFYDSEVEDKFSGTERGWTPFRYTPENQ